MKILLKNGSVKGEKVLDILIENDKIIKIGAPNTIKDNEAEIIDLTGLIVLPGLVDLHTHLREPGREDAETISTGSAAAAKVVTQLCTLWQTLFPWQTLQVLLNKCGI